MFDRPPRDPGVRNPVVEGFHQFRLAYRRQVANLVVRSGDTAEPVPVEAGPAAGVIDQGAQPLHATALQSVRALTLGPPHVEGQPPLGWTSAHGAPSGLPLTIRAFGGAPMRMTSVNSMIRPDSSRKYARRGRPRCAA